MELDEQDARQPSDVPIFLPRLGSRNRQVLLDADEFVTKYELDDIRDQIRIGALLLDDPNNIEGINGLTDEDIQTLKAERLVPPLNLKLIASVWWLDYPRLSCAGGVFMGYGKAMFLRLPESLGWWSSPHSLGTLVGPWYTILALSYFGRRKVAFVAAALQLAATIVVVITKGSRLLDLAMASLWAALECAIPIYLAEISPHASRGCILLTFSLAKQYGVLLANGATTDGIGSICANIMSQLIGILAVLFFSSESPYWLGQRGEMRQAHKVLTKYRDNGIQASRDLYRIYKSQILETKLSERKRTMTIETTQALVVCILVTLPDTILRILVHLAMAWTRDFDKILQDRRRVIPLVVVMPICLLFAAISSFYSRIYVERIGRRPVLLISMTLVAAVILSVKLVNFLLAPFGHQIESSLVPLFLLVPIAAGGWVPQVLVAELSSEGRDCAMAASQTTAWCSAAGTAYYFSEFSLSRSSLSELDDYGRLPISFLLYVFSLSELKIRYPNLSHTISEAFKSS
ncbi:uncharacterized protein BP01DRAFT_406723 [Aspergillus saccharolyticus JOP 1030-1]|uniref:MFS general substrate transporter n=1 Tax=Aspergillus saccharolyticus JOP 1030-1 TaxID=1450539 RepID=A0A318Z5M8_9EURO|nr:hypothetical protein BP01DRAFT_406723 [Aspergillus saccharolyticus JOP 1030-1]PYH41657.1 hypothetical protein BP01DRAFT_406723 [Aspergillus saccharolyticus JOP 1030-1]